MPELPEVETTRRGIAPLIERKIITGFVIRQRKLRWPIPPSIKQALNAPIEYVNRRAKYLLLSTPVGTIIIHLGMSGSLRVVPSATPAEKHDHIDIQFNNQTCLRLRDPRRFGAVLWTKRDPLQHKLIAPLGPEPLGNEFSGEHLFSRSRKRKVMIKPFIMNSHIVVGVGNIYASEALFMAGIHPQRRAGKVSADRYEDLATAIRQVLQQAIGFGGTTLQDFSAPDGKPGYFRNELLVYARAGEACIKCGSKIKQFVIGQRASYFCSRCQI